jgi:lipid-A-disaccharide synthase
MPDVHLWGLGSRSMAEAGVELLYDSADWSSIGFVEAVRVIPRLRLRVFPQVLSEIARRAPRAVVLIDFGAFNVRVARWCKERGVPVFYYFPPGSWRRKGGVNPEIARITDRIATPFPWSAEKLREVGANVEYVGHPLRELAQPHWTRAQFADRFYMEPGHPIIGLLPGSRGFEVEYNTPAMLGAARLIHQQIPGAQFAFGLASEAARQSVEQYLAAKPDFFKRVKQKSATLLDNVAPAEARLVTSEGFVVPGNGREKSRFQEKLAAQASSKSELPPLVLVENKTYDVMAHSDVLLVCSGTATLEAALLGTPMVICYRGSKLMEAEFRLRRVKVEHIGMPNIIADARIVPEFIQHDATPETLAEHALTFLRDPAARAECKAALAQVRETLCPPDARPAESVSERVAHMVLELAGLSPLPKRISSADPTLPETLPTIR